MLLRKKVQSGLAVFLAEEGSRLAGYRVGLLTNPTGVDDRLYSTVDLLAADRRIRLCSLFGPEHGIRGDAQAGIAVSAARDQRTALPVHSLYGETRMPTPEMVRDLDVLIFDIQDVGTRYATYISTLMAAQEAAARAGLLFVVFDRPEPLSGKMEGNILEPALRSFVGTSTLPICHGMTPGELARLFATEHDWPEPLVFPLQNWRRSLWFDETTLPWVQPSPNLPTLDTLTLYPGTCLLEGTTCSEGRGTTRPFEIVGAPDVDPFALAETLTRQDLPGVAFRPLYFTPTFSKHMGCRCRGVQIHILERNVLSPVILGLHLIQALHTLSPSFAWIQGADKRYFIDLLLGSEQIRRGFEAGEEIAEMIADWPEQQRAFAERRRPYLLYEEEA